MTAKKDVTNTGETPKKAANGNQPTAQKLDPRLPNDPAQLQKIIMQQQGQLQQLAKANETMKNQFAQASQKPTSEYQKMGDTSLVVVESYAGIRETRRFDFETSLVTVSTHYQYPQGQIVPKQMHFLEYTDTESLERLRQKLIELGGSPKKLVDKFPTLVEAKNPVVRKKNPIGFHTPKPSK